MIALANLFAICCPEDMPKAAQYAAKELRRLISRVSGYHLCPESRADFCISMRIDPQIDDDGSFWWEASENTIVIGGSAVNPGSFVYAVYALAEMMGFRFLAHDCETIPEQKVLTVREGRHEEKPAFRVRELFWRQAMDGAYAVKLRLNSARSSITPEQGGKAMFYNFSHTFDTLVPVAHWFDTHPEYFSQINGKRQRERTQLCLTNPDVLALCVEGVKRWKRQNPAYTIFSVAMNDWYNHCQCPACRKIDEEEGSASGTMVRFVNAVSRAVRTEFPDVMIHTFAYLYCRKPPRLTRPDDHVIIRLCSIECCFSHPIETCSCESGLIDVQGGMVRAALTEHEGENRFLQDLRGWSAITKNLFIWDYTTNYANYLQPFPNLGVLAANLKMFRRWGVSGMFEQGNFSHGRSSALAPLKSYLLGKLLWDPEQDVEQLIDDFAKGYWGAAAKPMRAYVSLWQNAAGPIHAGIYDTPNAAYLTDERLTQAEQLLAEAKALVEGVYLERIEREELSIRYVRLAQEDPSAAEHEAKVDAFAWDIRRLGITELFERRDLEGSFEVLKHSRYTADRTMAKPISYPI